MLEHKVKTLINKYGIWHLIHRLQIIIIIILFALIISMLVIPTTSDDNANSFRPVNIAETINNDDAADLMRHTDIKSPSTIWNHLFKPATAIRGRSMDGKIVEKIKSQLTLQCIMNIRDEKIAYINIKSKGMVKCKNGETVHDIFKVIDIQENRVDISILGQTVTLSK